MAVEMVVRSANERDAMLLGYSLRAEDEAEVRASSGREPLSVVIEAVATSVEAWACYFDGQLAFVWGVVAVKDAPGVGVAWMLTTDLVDRRPGVFWRYCRGALRELLGRWSLLVNAIDVRHRKAIRWAKRLGFQLEEPAPFGAEGRDFCLFSVTPGDLRV